MTSANCLNLKKKNSKLMCQDCEESDVLSVCRLTRQWAAPDCPICLR